MFRAILCVFISALCLSHVDSARADEFYRPSKASELDPTRSVEKAVRVKNAKVAWADYAKIRADFPKVAHYSDLEINDWLVHNFAYIGEDQSKLNHIRNTEIPVDETDLKDAYRPKEWKRAAVLEAHGPDGEVIGTADIKGFGHGKQSGNSVPEQVSHYNRFKEDAQKIDGIRLKDHSNGLMSFGEANAETARQRAAQALFELDGLPLETVESYAVIELPFDILLDGNKKEPAALYVRQSHFGRSNDAPVPSHIYMDDSGSKQQTRFGTAIDYGGVSIKDKRLADTYTTEQEINDVIHARPWREGHEVALKFRNGKVNAVIDYLRELIAPLVPDQNSSWGLAKIKARRAYQKDMNKKAAELKDLPPLKQYEVLKRYQHEHPFFQQGWENALKEKGYEEFIIRSLDRPDIAPSLLIKALQSPTSNFAVYASSRMERRQTNEMIPVFLEALNHKSVMIRNNAAKAIASWKDAPLELIEKVLDNAEVSVRGQVSDQVSKRHDIKTETLARLEKEPQSDYLSRAIKTELARRESIPLTNCLPLGQIIAKPDKN